MTAKQFRAMIAKLGISQRGVARLFKVNERTPRRWALGEVKVPHDVVENLTKLANGTVTTLDIERAYEHSDE
jgi:hypothetical protein